MSNCTNSAQQQEIPLHLRSYFVTALAILSVSAFCLNLFILYLFVSYRFLRTSSNKFIISLAIGIVKTFMAFFLQNETFTHQSSDLSFKNNTFTLKLKILDQTHNLLHTLSYHSSTDWNPAYIDKNSILFDSYKKVTYWWVDYLDHQRSWCFSPLMDVSFASSPLFRWPPWPFLA